MIKSIKHKGLRAYWTKGTAKGLNADWVQKINRIMAALEAAEEASDMDYPGSFFHALTGNRHGQYSVRLTGNFRVSFGWDAGAATQVDIEDYH